MAGSMTPHKAVERMLGGLLFPEYYLIRYQYIGHTANCNA